MSGAHTSSIDFLYGLKQIYREEKKNGKKLRKMFRNYKNVIFERNSGVIRIYCAWLRKF